MDDHRDDKYEETELEKKGSGTEEKKSDDSGSDYEDVCFICRRPESKAGKMFRLPNHICVCDDCMHKTMDTVSQFDYQGLLNNPNMGNGQGFPNISFVNLADLQGDGGIPNKQKPKKKRKKEAAEIDSRDILPQRILEPGDVSPGKMQAAGAVGERMGGGLS